MLKLSDSVIKDLKLKHPRPATVADNSSLFGPINEESKCYFDSIDKQSILKATLNTKGSAGPSGMDSDLYSRMLCSKKIALLTSIIATTYYHPNLIESYVAARLIRVDKKPGIRPIGVGENSRQSN